MAEPNVYRRIIDLTRDVSRVEPDSDEVRMAVQSMRDRMTRPQSRAAGRTWRRKVVLVSSGIAALVGIGISILAVISFPQSATAAAENLNRSAAATHAYKGWVHVRPQTSGDPAPASQPAMVERDVVIHFNTADGTFAMQFELNGIRCAVLSQPAKQQQEMYSAAVRQIRIDNLSKDSANNWFKHIAEVPVQLADVLAAMEKDGAVKLDVKESQDGELSRFDLTFKGDPEKAPAQYREMVSEPRTVWTDPKSGLIRKMQTRTGGRAVLAEFTYGSPEIRDIYDLGVPRDAMVLDARNTTPSPLPSIATQPAGRQETPDPSVDLKVVSERIASRVERGLGDHVAVLCEETVLDPPQPMRREGRITLYAREGDRAHQTNYLAAPAGVFMGLLGFPPGWPTPKLDDLLPMLDRVRTTSGYVSGYITDGKDLWQIKPKVGPKPTAVFEKIDTSKSIPQNRVPRIASEIWPQIPSGDVSTQMKSIGMTVSKVEAVRDARHVRLIGIRVTREMDLKIEGLKFPKWQQTVYWIDPERDDMPVETVRRSRPDIKDEEAESVTRIQYESYAALPDGKLYPTKWRSEQFRPDLPAKQRVIRHAYSLQIFPDTKLDAKWYADPQASEPAASKK
jgi:hypothetical protein